MNLNRDIPLSELQHRHYRISQFSLLKPVFSTQASAALSPNDVFEGLDIADSADLRSGLTVLGTDLKRDFPDTEIAEVGSMKTPPTAVTAKVGLK